MSGKQQDRRTLRVAVVQVVSENGNLAGNLRHAEGFIKEAAARGARLVLLPEFMSTGYIFTKAIWEAAEPAQGPTVKWMKELSAGLGIWIGTSFLEAEGRDFFNTFVITNPQGGEDGRVRKQTPAVGETYFTRGDRGPHIIQSGLGRIGVGICYENRLAYIPRLMYSQSADILLQPHSSPAPTVNRIYSREHVDKYRRDFSRRSQDYAAMLGIPVVLSNKSGRWVSPWPGIPFLRQDTSFPGLSAISESDGSLKAQLGEAEGVIVEDVLLDPGRKIKSPPVTYGNWAVRKESAMAGLVQVVMWMGEVWYKFSRERRIEATRISAAR